MFMDALIYYVISCMHQIKGSTTLYETYRLHFLFVFSSLVLFSWIAILVVHFN